MWVKSVSRLSNTILAHLDKMKQSLQNLINIPNTLVFNNELNPHEKEL